MYEKMKYILYTKIWPKYDSYIKIQLCLDQVFDGRSPHK